MLMMGEAAMFTERTLFVQRKSMLKMEDLRMQDSVMKLNEYEFRDGRISEFPNFARETLHRYKNSNRDLYKLVLRMNISDNDYGASAALATELILYALNYLSVKKLDVGFGCRKPFVLPCRVFESKSLLELTADNCRIDKIGETVTSLPLVALHLECVLIGDDARLAERNYSFGNDLLRKLLEKCPLLEYFYLFEGAGFSKVNFSRMHNLKFCVMDIFVDGACFVEFFDQGPTQFRNLTTLILFNNYHVESTFFHDFMFKFPSLIEFSFHHNVGFEQVVISSPTLKYLTLEVLQMDENKMMVLDVPNICDFKYWGWGFPPLAISTIPKECESYVVVHCTKDLPSSWFLSLRDFLQKLSSSGSRVSVGLSYDFYALDVDPCIAKLMEEDISGGPAIRVENLALENLLGRKKGPPLSDFSDILSGLFTFSRPNFITLLGYSTRLPEKDQSVMELLCDLVTEKVDWKHDLKQVAFETLVEEENVKEWRPILWDDLISSFSLGNGPQIRLKLAWSGDQSN